MSRSRYLFTGDRDWDDVWASTAVQTIMQGLDLGPGYDTVVHGAARGIDRLVDVYARQEGAIVEPFPADWDQYGPAAGPIRNQEMLVSGHFDMCFAFHCDLEHSHGTKDMVDRAKKAGIPTFVIACFIPPPTLFDQGKPNA